MVRLKRNYTDTSQFDNDILPWGKALATSLQWLYDDDEFEDDSLSEAEYDRNMLYYMDGVLPICDFMSVVTDVIYLAFKDFGGPNIKNYINLLQDFETRKWGDKPHLQYDGECMILGKVSIFTTEVILWAAYLYCHIRKDFEPENERVVRADKLLYKLYARQTCLKPELVKDTFLMKHFNKTAVAFLKHIPTQGKDSKEGGTHSDPKSVDMEESVIGKISANNIRYYYEGWRNGKHGSICQKDGIYRFVEMARGKSGMLDDVNRNEEDNPIVAKGIVAYWLQFNSRMDTVIKRLTKYNCEIPKDIREQFENYTQIRFEQFKREHRDDPNTLDWDWDREFYANVIIPHEMAFNKLSEALFDYISDSDIVLVRGVMNSYIKYLKKCRSEKGYRVSPELLVLRSIDTLNEFALEDLEDYEINTVLDRLENEGYVKVAWVEGHSLEAVRLLDKGRAYLKQLEEGTCVIDVAPIDTQQPSSEQVSIEISSQMTQLDDDSEYDQDANDEEWDDDDEEEGEYEAEDEDEVAPEVREYDTTYDYIFDPRVKPKALFNAMKGIKYNNKITERRFYYVAYRVFDAINYFSKGTSEHQYLQWINLHFNDYEDRWIDDHDHIYLFRFKLDGTAKKLKVHPSKWNSIKMYSDLAAIHYKLANDLKNTFTFVVDDNGDELKDSESYEHLKDYPQYLSGAQWIVDKYLVPDEAYVNKGRQSHIK